MPRPEVPARGPWARGLQMLALLFIYYLVAAASFSGYFSKWGFRDDGPRFSLKQMIDGTAHRPFVYRQLVPTMAKALDTAVPEAQRARLEGLLAGRNYSPETIFTKAAGLDKPGQRLPYFITYYLSFLFLFAAVIQMHRLCVACGFDAATAYLTPLLFALIFPLLLTGGGYYYDIPELFFFVTAVLLAMRGRWAWLVVLTVFATLNKESFLLFVPTLYPFLRNTMGRAGTGGTLAAMALLAVVINVVVKQHYAGNPGASLEVNLVGNLLFMSQPLSYLQMETNYGVVTPRGFHVLHIACIAGLALAGYAALPAAVRMHAKIAAAINVPLFLLAAPRDELRNLSYLFPVLLLLMAVWVGRRLREPEGVANAVPVHAIDAATARPMPPIGGTGARPNQAAM